MCALHPSSIGLVLAGWLHAYRVSPPAGAVSCRGVVSTNFLRHHTHRGHVSCIKTKVTVYILGFLHRSIATKRPCAVTRLPTLLAQAFVDLVLRREAIHVGIIG